MLSTVCLIVIFRAVSADILERLTRLHQGNLREPDQLSKLQQSTRNDEIDEEEENKSRKKNEENKNRNETNIFLS